MTRTNVAVIGSGNTGTDPGRVILEVQVSGIVLAQTVLNGYRALLRGSSTRTA
jgi:hypothetical protein